MGRLLEKALLLAFGVLCLWLIGPDPGIRRAEGGRTAIVTASRLNVRSGPGIGNSSVMTLRKGAVLAVLEEEGGWLKIRYQGRTGWVKNRARYVRLDGRPGVKPESTVATEAVTAIDQAKKEAESIHRKIEAGRAEVVTFTKTELAMVKALNDIDFSLNQAGKRHRALARELEEVEKTIAETEAAVERLSSQLVRNRTNAAGRLVALYKLSRIGKIHILASATSVYELFQRETILGRILDHDRKLLNRLAEDSAEHDRMLKLHQSQKTAKAALAADLEKQISEMRRQKSRKGKLLAEIRGKKSLQLAALETWKQSARELDEKIESLSFQASQSEPAANLPARPFSELKGLLKIPVRGKIVSTFGSYRNPQFKVVNFRSGIDIRAERGEPIRAVCVGKVVFAEWFKGYGNMMIIDHGDGFHTVYASAEELFKQVGESVETGEVVATVGDTGSEIGPKLYFEIRKNRKPVDPLQWVDGG